MIGWGGGRSLQSAERLIRRDGGGVAWYYAVLRVLQKSCASCPRREWDIFTTRAVFTGQVEPSARRTARVHSARPSLDSSPSV